MRHKIAATLLLAVLLLGGCKFEPGNLLHRDQPEKPELVKVMIYFTDGQTLSGYVENLGVEGSSQIYTGGSSVNYLYDKDGKITGCFNYQRVLYMKILPENDKN